MESPLGEVEIEFQKVERDGDKLVIMAKAGVWDSTIYMEKGELGHLLKIMMCKAAVGVFLKWLFTSRGKASK